MLSVFLVTFPFFALVLCGFVATWRGIFPLQAIAGVNAFVLYFALPCMLYKAGSSLPFAQLMNLPILLLYVLCQFLLVAGCVAASRLRGMDWNNSAFGALVTAFPNTGFMGLPLLVALLGDAAAGPAIVTMLVDMVFTTSLCLALSRMDGAAGNARAALLKALKGVLTNPMPWAILLGALASFMEWKLPQALDQTTGLLGSAATPVALFAVGAVLARSQMVEEEYAAPASYVPLALVKLFVHPLLVLGLGHAAMAAGLPIHPFALLVVALVAALPSASNVTLLAGRYGAHNGRIAHIILVSTALAFVSFSAAVTWLVEIPGTGS
ncbi:MAG: AEC family transporter [Comamonas sp.]|nr:AEC family transporter [Comamonas sp.]